MFSSVKNTTGFLKSISLPCNNITSCFHDRGSILKYLVHVVIKLKVYFISFLKYKFLKIYFRIIDI